MGFVKIGLLISNLIFVIAGAVLFFLGLAIWLKLSPIKAIHGIDVWALPAIAVLVIVVGGIVLFIAFFGCCGAIKENTCMLTTYSIFMLVLTAMSLAVAIPLFIKKGDVTKVMVKGLNKVIEKNYTLLHPVEKTLRCCGLDGPPFYENRTIDVNNTWSYSHLPPSCCLPSSNKTEMNGNITCDITIAHSIGCAKYIEEKVLSLSLVIGLVLCVVACIELLAAVSGLYLKKESGRAKYW